MPHDCTWTGTYFGHHVEDVSSDDFHDRMGFRVHQLNTQMSVDDAPWNL